MKPKKQIPLKLLRDFVESKLSPFSSSPKLCALKEKSLALLTGDSADFETLEGIWLAIDQAADALDDGSVFAMAQDLISELDSLVRTVFSEGVPVFPELQVKLSLAKATTMKAPGTGRAEPGSRTRLGGKPDWLQPDATPICNCCQKAMTFIAQIDSVANEDSKLGRALCEKNSFMFADVGMIYVFWCSGCMDTQAVLQCG